jgi:hypothetical protein
MRKFDICFALAERPEAMTFPHSSRCIDTDARFFRVWRPALNDRVDAPSDQGMLTMPRVSRKASINADDFLIHAKHLPSPQLVYSPFNIRTRSWRLNEFPWFRRRLVPNAYRPAGLIRRSKCRLAIQHLPRSHVPQMRSETI